MTKRYAFLAVAIGTVMMLAGCDYLPFGYTPVKDILTAPTSFEGKEVKLKGKVEEVTKLPIVDFQKFEVRDETGKISVTTRGSLPAVNADVALKGTVTSAAIIGGHALGLHVKETKRLK